MSTPQDNLEAVQMIQQKGLDLTNWETVFCESVEQKLQEGCGLSLTQERILDQLFLRVVG